MVSTCILSGISLKLIMRLILSYGYALLFFGLSGHAFSQEAPASELVEPPVQALTEEEVAAAKEELDTRIQIKNSFLSLSETMKRRRDRLSELLQDLRKAKDDSERAPIQAEIDGLTAELEQTKAEIEIVVLGLQSQEYLEIGTEKEASSEFDLGKEIAQIFQPLIISLERATEPSRRMEELLQLSNRTKRREEVAQATLDNIAQFRLDGEKYPKYIEDRLANYEEVWNTRLQESVDLGTALNEQLEAAHRMKGSTFKQFVRDFGDFVLNRGVNLLLALGSGLGFLVLCQFFRIGIANFYRARRTGVVSAPIRIIGMFISIVGVVGALIIAITIFNIRHDWLMLAMSLLLALAISWSFVQALPSLMEETRVLLNLGSVREGERTLVNGLPYRVERLSLYSKLINPALNGGSLIFPVREMVNMHSRPVIEGEAWFPTNIGDWIVRNGQHYEIMDQSPEHVIMRRPGGSEDFVPVREFLDTLFESLSGGYRRSHTLGLSYKHIDLAPEEIPRVLSEKVRKRVASRIGEEAILGIDTRLIDLGSSSLDYKILVDIGPNQGQYWENIQTDISNGVVDACLEKGWEIPFPQLVVHNPA